MSHAPAHRSLCCAIVHEQAAGVKCTGRIQLPAYVISPVRGCSPEGTSVTEQEIEDALAALGQELQRLGVQQPIRILVVGGAYMLTQLHNRLATKDIDVLLI